MAPPAPTASRSSAWQAQGPSPDCPKRKRTIPGITTPAKNELCICCMAGGKQWGLQKSKKNKKEDKNRREAILKKYPRSRDHITWDPFMGSLPMAKCGKDRCLGGGFLLHYFQPSFFSQTGSVFVGRCSRQKHHFGATTLPT